MDELKKGDRVRVTMVREGVVEDANENGVYFRTDDLQPHLVVYGDGHTIEKLTE